MVKNFAFIDGENLNLSIRNLGWKLDFKRFRIYLKEKYGVSEAYLFIGYIDGNTELYASLQRSGLYLHIQTNTNLHRWDHERELRC